MCRCHFETRRPCRAGKCQHDCCKNDRTPSALLQVFNTEQCAHLTNAHGKCVTGNCQHCCCHRLIINVCQHQIKGVSRCASGSCQHDCCRQIGWVLPPSKVRDAPFKQGKYRLDSCLHIVNKHEKCLEGTCRHDCCHEQVLVVCKHRRNYRPSCVQGQCQHECCQRHELRDPRAVRPTGASREVWA